METTGTKLLPIFLAGILGAAACPGSAPAQRPRPGEAGDVKSAWQDAKAMAVRKDKRILVSIPGRTPVHAFDEAVRKLGRTLNHEFERLTIRAGDGELAQELGLEVDPQAHFIAVLDREGAVLHRAPAGELLENPAAFIERWKVPAKDARALLARSLEEARRTKRRVLVHLGAPW